MAGGSCARERAARRRFLSGSPWCRRLPRRNVGLPGSWVVLFLRAVVVHPAGCDLPSPTSLSRRPPAPSGRTKPWASETNTVFVAAFPRPTRSRTYASPVASPRPSQGSLPVGAALPFAGRVSHPLDDKPNFMSSSHLSLLSDQPFLVALFSQSSPWPSPGRPRATQRQCSIAFRGERHPPGQGSRRGASGFGART